MNDFFFFVLGVGFFLFLRILMTVAFRSGIAQGYYQCLRRMGRSHEAALEYMEEALKAPPPKSEK